jgi:undecaprenyl-diphosphatase
VKALRAHVHGWLSRQERLMLLAMATAVLGTAVFFLFSLEVLKGQTQKLDEWAVGWARNPTDLSLYRGPEWVLGVVRDVTALGSVSVIGLVSLTVIGFATLRGNHRLALLVLAAAGGGFAMNSLLKNLFDRPRPFLPHVLEVKTRSFPSGHAMVSAAVYLSIAALLATRERRRILKAYILSVGMLLTVLVGLSRIYLGMHYPSDVLAGWLGGLIWAVLCALTARAVLGIRRGA